jgi:hypothetical protein
VSLTEVSKSKQLFTICSLRDLEDTGVNKALHRPPYLGRFSAHHHSCLAVPGKSQTKFFEKVNKYKDDMVWDNCIKNNGSS